MKAGINDAWRAVGCLRLLAGALAVVAALAATGGVAAEGGEPDLRPEGVWREGLRAEGLRPEGLVSALRANGAQVLSLGQRGGLEGYFVTPAQGAGYGLYVTGDGHAVAGLLYGPDGTEVTGAQLAAVRSEAAAAPGADTGSPEAAAPAVTAHAEIGSAVVPSSPASLTGLFERSASAFGFSLGERGPVVVLLGDATCSWSRSAAARLGRAALDGRMQLRVVPVAVLGASAARRAAGIAANPDPAVAWFAGGGAADPRAGDTRAGDTRAGDRIGAERIARNNALFDAWGANAVPLIAWRSHGGAVGHRIGDIDDVGAWLRETLVPETLVPDTLGWETGLE